MSYQRALKIAACVYIGGLNLSMSGCATHTAAQLSVNAITPASETAITGIGTTTSAIDPYTVPPPVAEAAPSEFLENLSESDLAKIREEALRTTTPIWESVDARSQKIQHRMLPIFEELNAPKELLFLPVAESGYNPYALSPAGAFGLWQLMPRTAIQLGAHHKNGIDGRRHVESSTKAAVSYLLSLHKQFDNWPIAICAYNLGPSGVARRLRKKPWTYEMGLDKLPFPAETRHYVKQILGMIALAEDGKLTFSTPIVTKNLEIKAPIDLKHLETASGLEENEIFRLNPGLDYRQYQNHDLTLHLPEANIQLLHDLLEENPEVFKPKFISIAIEKGDSLWAIARKYHITISHLKQLNLEMSNHLSIGKQITVPALSDISAVSNLANPLLTQGRRIRYSVRSGDSLWTIAKKFGTSTATIARTNQISKQHLLRPGDKLWIVARFKPH